MDMDPAEQLAYLIIFGRFNGGTWNWNTMSWDKLKT
jgi:hypothetical protein